MLFWYENTNYQKNLMRFVTSVYPYLRIRDTIFFETKFTDGII